MTNKNRTESSRGLPRSSFTDDFFTTNTFDSSDPPSQPRSFQRSFTDRGGLFRDLDDGNDDIDQFFNGFPNIIRDQRSSFFDEPSFFRSTLPRNPLFNQQLHDIRRDKNSSDHGSPFDRTSRTQHKQAMPSQDTSDYQKVYNEQDANDGTLYKTVHRIPIRKQQTEHAATQGVNTHPKCTSTIEGDDISNTYLNQTDKRRRFSNNQPQQNEHNYANRGRRFCSIPDITIEDYDDRESINESSPIGEENKKGVSALPEVIPLPAPAIPLPAPPSKSSKQQHEQQTDEKFSNACTSDNNSSLSDSVEGLKEHLPNNIEVEYTTNIPVQTEHIEQNQLTCGTDVSNVEHLIQLLDDTERRVEALRETASRLEQEKEIIFDSIKNIKLRGSSLLLKQGEHDELVLNADRLFVRCQSVDVCVKTPRNEHQTRALQQVNEVIHAALQEDACSLKSKIQGFLNACMSEETGHIDEKFQTLIIACAADDQKRIRRRLAQIIDEQTQQPLSQFTNIKN